MGTYRTTPEEVEAIQYTGSTTKPFNETVPDWVWGAFSYGTLKFTGLGINIEYNGLSENVMPNDWLVMGIDSVIRACDDKVFTQYYTPYRQRRTKAEIEAERLAEAAAAAAFTSIHTTVAAPAAVATTTEDDVEEMERALAAAFPETLPQNQQVVAA
jgi:hypothetical protein